jgi:hypothetical protein
MLPSIHPSLGWGGCQQRERCMERPWISAKTRLWTWSKEEEDDSTHCQQGRVERSFDPKTTHGWETYQAARSGVRHLSGAIPSCDFGFEERMTRVIPQSFGSAEEGTVLGLGACGEVSRYSWNPSLKKLHRQNKLF